MREQIAEYVVSLYRDIPMAVYEGLLSVLCLGVVVILACYGLKRGWRKIAGLILAEYVFVIYCSTVIFRTAADGNGHDFHPFWSYTAIQEGREELLVENLMNVIVFVPVGVMLGCAFRSMTWWKVLLIGCGISASIEALQFFFHRGFSETDDVMHNTLGCVIGYGLFVLAKQIARISWIKQI